MPAIVSAPSRLFMVQVRDFNAAVRVVTAQKLVVDGVNPFL
jgi:hypothetical protein